jgi:sugar phosphate isomerase/epimerase
VSSAAIARNELQDILLRADELNIDKIELGAGIRYEDNLYQAIIDASRKFKFSLHNYFPPPEMPFLLNLASGSEEKRQRSILFCKNAINLCAAIEGAAYSVHCGFTFDGDGSKLGCAEQMQLTRIGMEQAMENFIISLNILIAYAEKKKVKFAIENNAVAGFAIENNLNNIALGADEFSLAHIFENVIDGPLYLMFDLGHAKLNHESLGQSIHRMLSKFGNHIIGVHISDNDQQNDLHQPMTRNSDLLKHLRSCHYPIWVLETNQVYENQIASQINLLESINRIT